MKPTFIDALFGSSGGPQVAAPAESRRETLERMVVGGFLLYNTSVTAETARIGSPITSLPSCSAILRSFVHPGARSTSPGCFV